MATMGAVFVAAGTPLTAPAAFSGLSSGARVPESWLEDSAGFAGSAAGEGEAAGDAGVACAAGDSPPPDREQETTSRAAAASVRIAKARPRPVFTGSPASIR